MWRLAQPDSHLPAVEMKSHTLCLAGETSVFSWHSAPWWNPIPTHSGQSCHEDAHRTLTVNHIWQRPGVKTLTGTLKWPSVTEWNPFSCCMDQLFPSLIPAPHSAHSGLHSLFLLYTSGLIFLISWYPSPRYKAKPLSLKSCPVITVWLNTHLWDRIWGKHYGSCQNWGRVSNHNLKCLSAVKFRIAEEAGIQTIAEKLEKTAMAAEVRDGGEREHCVTVDSETEGTGTHHILENMFQTLFFRWNKAPTKFKLIHLCIAITTCRFENGNHW